MHAEHLVARGSAAAGVLTPPGTVPRFLCPPAAPFSSWAPQTHLAVCPHRAGGSPPGEPLVIGHLVHRSLVTPRFPAEKPRALPRHAGSLGTRGAGVCPPHWAALAGGGGGAGRQAPGRGRRGRRGEAASSPPPPTSTNPSLSTADPALAKDPQCLWTGSIPSLSRSPLGQSQLPG